MCRRRVIVAVVASCVLAVLQHGAFGDDDVIVKGRIVDASGTPVSRAVVLLDLSFRPLVADGYDEAVPSERRPLTVVSREDGRFALTRTAKAAQRFDRDSEPGPVSVLARDGRRVSELAIGIFKHGVVDVGDLALQDGIRLTLTVRDSDGHGVPAADVNFGITDLARDLKDPDGALYTWVGRTDQRGEVRVASVPRRDFGKYFVRATNLGFPFVVIGNKCLEGADADEMRLSVTVPNTARAMGRVVDSDGNAAAGLWVVGKEQSSGDPPAASYVRTDRAGQFSLDRVVPGKTFILVCIDRPRPIRAVLVPKSSEKVIAIGDVRLPRLRSMRFVVVDEAQRPLRGNLWIERSDIGHGGRPSELDEHGAVVIESVPVGVLHTALVRVEHPQLGLLEEEFPLPAGAADETVFRVTGKGVIIARLRSSAGSPMTVRDGWIQWGAKGAGSFVGGEQSELRFRIGFFETALDLTIGAEGLSQVKVPGVRMRSDGPTVLDVTFK